MPKAKNKTLGMETNDNMDSWTVPMLKDYLRTKKARLEGTRPVLLQRAKCYARQEPEDPAIIAE